MKSVCEFIVLLGNDSLTNFLVVHFDLSGHCSLKLHMCVVRYDKVVNDPYNPSCIDPFYMIIFLCGVDSQQDH